MAAQTLRARFLTVFLLPTVAFFAVAAWVGYSGARALLEEELGRHLAAVAASAASQLSAERVLSVEPGDDVAEGSRTHRNLSRQLEALREATGVRRVLAFDLQGRVRVDAGGRLPVGTEVPELSRDRHELARVFAGQRAASQVLFRGSDGRLYKSGYAPLRLDAEVVGAVGVEGSAELFAPLARLLRAYLAWVVASVAALGTLVVLTARALSRPLQSLVQTALRIGRGDLETKVTPALAPTRELEVLARSLEAMRAELLGRDRQLKLMLAGVAHEVRNPMGGIELFAGLLAEELRTQPTSGETSGYVARIQRELAHLKGVVDDFLAFAREDRLQHAEVDAEALLRQALERVTPDAQRAQVRLELSAAPGALLVDGSLLDMALVNLLRNAVQASPPGAAVRVRGQPRGERYVIEVEDEGPGIPPAVEARIFEPFFTTREQGTGLGLPLARKVLLAHQGSLEVESAPGRTVFRAELPR